MTATPTTQAPSANRQIARAASTVMAAFILSNVIGLVRQFLVSRAFGTGADINAYTVASRLPDVIFTLIAGGALASAFIPTFTSFITRDDRPGAWRLASAIFNLACLLLSLVSGLAAIAAPQLVRYILASQFSPEDQATTAALLRILLLSPLIFGISGLAMSVLNVYQVFLWPALASSMYWLGMIVGVLFLAPRWGIYGLAWGAVLGAVMHLGIQVPALLKLNIRYFPTLGLDMPEVREVGRLIGPRLFGVAVVQLNLLISTIIAAAQPEGSAVYLDVAWRVVTLPEVAVAQAIAIAALPTFSAQVARGELSQMRASMAATLRGILLLSVPASLGLMVLRKPVVALLFQYGKFDATSTEMVAWALLWFAAGLVGHSVVEIASRAFYSLHDTRTPVIIGSAAMGLNILFSLAFSALFSFLGWAPHGGLALANSLATALEMLGLLVFMRRRLGGLGGQAAWTGLGQSAAAGLAMSLALWVWTALTSGYPNWLVALGGIAAGGLVYLLGVTVLKAPEVQAVVRLAKRVISKQ